mmetsp:Transcript_41383/g.96950  ORF Transcript_41383/g.96950 Transcript_41383/m.96950 type:complete len:99 (+) Transcript_41383:135-431(+)
MPLKTLGVARHQCDGRAQLMGNSINKAALTLPLDSQAFLQVVESQGDWAQLMRLMIRIEQMITKIVSIKSLELMIKLLKRQHQFTAMYKTQQNKGQQD